MALKVVCMQDHGAGYLTHSVQILPKQFENFLEP